MEIMLKKNVPNGNLLKINERKEETTTKNLRVKRAKKYLKVTITNNC